MQCLLFARLGSTAICAAHEDPMIASLNLQEHLNIIEKWLNKWKINVNESKSSQITVNPPERPLPCIDQTTIPETEVVKYLGLHLDCRLNWKEHIATKRKQIDYKPKRSTS
jgi:hypothetical protein